MRGKVQIHAEMMDIRSTLAGIWMILVTILLPLVSDRCVQAGPSEGIGQKYKGILKTGEKDKEEKLTGFHVYWKDGLHLESRKKNFTMKIGGMILGDGGYIGADNDLKIAFPDQEGGEADFRRLSLVVSGTIRPLSAIKDRKETTEDQRGPVRDTITAYAPYDAVEFKVDIDFAQVRDIKDNWIRFPNVPFLGHFTFGHWKEPFSLEELTPIANITFMERALPTDAFALGRNLGIRYDGATSNQRITWGLGGFLNTGSFSDVGEATDRLSEANGFNITARLTGLPWCEEEGARLLHLGLSYSHGVRDDKDEEDTVGFRARPESRLTDERLVDTGEFFVERVNKINPELAIVSGPLSLQGEYFHTSTDADDEGDPQFWGFYVLGSYFLTGEHRNYDRSRGVFSRLRPERNFHPLEGGWGALELGLRYSFIDLNDEAIRGGKESNFTAGLNWYLTPHSRFMFNYIYANARDRAKSPAVDNGRANIFQARFQLAF